MTSWAQLTSSKVDCWDRGVPVVLPVGAVEQYGPHLPLMTDAAIAEHFRQQLDSELSENVLTLPTIVVGYSAIHQGFRGTLSVRHSTLLDQLTDIAESALTDGFRNLIFLNSNGGNEGVVQVALEELGARWPGRRIVRTTWWRIAVDELKAISDTGPGGVGHACELETSLMLLIEPELVDLAAAPPRANQPAFTWDSGDMLRSSSATLYRSLADVAETGVFGEPRTASVAKGKAISEAVTARLVALVRSLREAPRSAWS